MALLGADLQTSTLCQANRASERAVVQQKQQYPARSKCQRQDVVHCRKERTCLKHTLQDTQLQEQKDAHMFQA
jgi:hypothetical protein